MRTCSTRSVYCLTRFDALAFAAAPSSGTSGTKGSRGPVTSSVAPAPAHSCSGLWNIRASWASCTIRDTPAPYVYGRTRQRKVLLPGQVRNRRLPREEWKVFLPDVHPRYLTWDEYESNQVTLRHNARGYGSDRRWSPPREGVALLQGLVVCGRCGDRMTVRYETHQGHPAPVYTCQRRGIATATPVCQVIHGAALDAAISDFVLDAVTPASVDVARGVRRAPHPRGRSRLRASRAGGARA